MALDKRCLTLQTLADPTFLIFAARKAARYVLKHNVFSDKLAVARFMAHVESNCRTLGRSLLNGRYGPQPAAIVPAPKRVHIEEDERSTYICRLLSDTAFKDQIVFTALTSLLSESWETSWGRPDKSEYPEIVSFGNRLALNWETDHPRLSMTGSQLYREWGEDYSRFVKTTTSQYNAALEVLKNGEHLTLLCTDIANFYPRVHRRLLSDILLHKVADRPLRTFAANILQGISFSDVPVDLDSTLVGDSVRGCAHPKK